MTRSIVIAAIAAASTIAAVPTAQASFSSEMKAAGKVERKVNARHPGYNPTAFCDQTGRRRYWCTFMASKGDCTYMGKARVTGRGMRVRIVADDRTCF